MMNIPCAWTITNGDPSIVVAVADLFPTGLYNNHLDLVDKVVELVGSCDGTDPGYHHGFQSFGAIAGIRNNDKCIAGTGGLTRVAGICGNAHFSLAQTEPRGYKIVSMSSGTPDVSQTKDATENGTVILLFGLDDHHTNVRNIPGVIHIGRANLDGDWWQYGLFDENRELDVLVVVEGIGRIYELNSCEDPGGQGSSIGTPMAAGIMALMRAVNPCLSPPDIESIIKSTAGPIPTNATPQITASGIINAYDAVLAAQNFIPVDQEWNTSQQINNAYVSGNLDITSGAHVTVQGNVYIGPGSALTIHPLGRLTVTGSVNFADGASCIVKRNAMLELDGGKLTSSWCSDQWEGVIVEGDKHKEQSLVFDRPNADQDPRAGILSMRNQSVIEHAKIAVSMFASHLPYPQKLDYFGGLIIADNSTFRENEKAVAFGKYLRFDDKSSFTDVHFTDHKHTTTHWSNRGVEYNNCIFEEYETSAITTIDAAIKVINGCEFYSTGHTEYDQAGITLVNTVPHARVSKIGELGTDPNSYFGGYHGIYAGAIAGLASTELINNIFIGGQTGINVDGSSNWKIEHNDFFGQTSGTILISNGGYDNRQINNDIGSCRWGILAHLDNKGYQFLSNCFNNSVKKDFYLNGQLFPSFFPGIIRENQGSGDVAASNLFSIKGTPRGIITRESEIPYYHILTGVPVTDRRVPNSFDFDRTVFDSQVELERECGTLGNVGFPVDEYYCIIPISQADIKEAIFDLKNEIIPLEESLAGEVEYSNGWYYFHFLIAQRKDCLARLKMRLMELMANEENYSDLTDFFDNDELLFKTIVFGILFDAEQYNLASDFLMTFNNSDEEQADFVFTQQLNLQRVQVENYEISETDLQELYQVGHGLRPMNGFARSLYFALTGERIEINIPMDEEGTQNRLAAMESDVDLQIAPNPFHSEFEVSLNKESADYPKDLKIYDMKGNQVYSKQYEADIQQKIEINVNHLEAAMYFVVVRNAVTQELIGMKKIIKL